ncbi:MAG: geranylgeranylglycerol-phosphate geranylgeranyltransferase [Flavobacteriia bacterium]|nr:geranylgeranylglycerol-phosphate geranylgeranyltransferase [Flavobacteriia bacterium]
MWAFIKLIRPINTLILFLCMYSTRFFYLNLINPSYKSALFERIDFFLFVFATVLILAGGNIINDYFDVKADQINKPDKVIINKYIKQRFAILSHWTLNGLALGIGIYLSIKSRSFSFLFVFLLAINLLWFYSVRFKRRLWVGNIVVSLLLACIPFICLMYFNVFEIHFQSETKAKELLYLVENNRFIVLFSMFAFFINLLREIIKDVIDTEGDKKIKAITLPIFYGINKTKKILIIFFIIGIILQIFFVFWISKEFQFLFNLPFYFILFLKLMCFIFLLISKWKSCSFLLKTVLIIGILSPFYWLMIF